MSNPGRAGAPRDLRARDLEQLIEQQIRAGVYGDGARLPTVRELGEQHRVNKNTAARAYQSLARRGLIDMSRGRGAFVRPPADRDDAGWQQRAEQIIEDARRRGLSRAQLLASLGHAVERIYAPAAPRVLFVECNRADLEALGGELSLITATPMDLALLDAATRDAEALARRYDLLVTSFQHLGQLRQAAPGAARGQIVGVLVTPSHDSLLDLARLHVTTFGLVCDAPSTIESLTYTILTYNPAAAVLPALIDDDDQLQRVIAQADAIVVTRSCRDRLAALAHAQPVVTVVFTIDQQSIDFLRSRLQELRELHPALAASP